MSEYSFALCLSHDIDRVYKTYQYLYEAATELNPKKALGAFTANNPWWQFGRIMDIESGLGVRSSFNVLDEQHISERPRREWLTKDGIQLYAGRYDVTDPQLRSTLRTLDRFGWEIGLQGSYESSVEPERFADEKRKIERETETTPVGNRQHHWKLSPPDTWRQLRDCGIKYDTSLGASHSPQPEYDVSEVIRPFDDEFVVFPWSLMDGAVMEVGNYDESLAAATDVLEQTHRSQGVLVADWHQRVFHVPDFPGWASLYEELIARALDMGAWVGPPGEFYQALSHPDGTVEGALKTLADEADSEELRVSA